MKKETIGNITTILKEKYPDLGLINIKVDENKGTSTFFMQPKKELSFLKPEQAAVIRRDPMDRTILDLAKKDPFTEEPVELFKRATKYYYTDPLVGSVTNLLANLAKKGFENDVSDANIKNFYDAWCFDVKLEEVLEWIFLDFFKVGQVHTYKGIAKYTPRISYLSPIPGKTTKKKKEKGAKKNIWSKGHLPIAYTVLNPLLVNVEGSLLFDKHKVTLTPPPELRELLKKPSSELTPDEKEMIKLLPSDLKAAAESGGTVTLDPRLVGSITYRKQPYERYAKPRSTRIFDSLDYKKSLCEADLSTLDGISNYILKVTIGSDEYPATTQEELEAVGELFNTPSKSFSVIWNHTLQVEKIVSPEISSILGKEKYGQVNDDISAGLAVSRALIDGTGALDAAEATLMVKGLMEEINYARRQVTRWIYNEYQQIAEVMAFDRFPRVRWDEAILKDDILYMATISSLVDRRMLSYRTSLEVLGFDYEAELSQMEVELPSVQEGVWGLRGSPWQQSKDIQDVQNAPKGTPSDGRPKGNVPKKKEPETDPSKKLKTTVKPPSKKSTSDFKEVIKDMTNNQYKEFLMKLSRLRI